MSYAKLVELDPSIDFLAGTVAVCVYMEILGRDSSRLLTSFREWLALLLDSHSIQVCCNAFDVSDPSTAISVKVRFQNPDIASKYKSTLHAITTIIKEENISGLYKGITSPLVPNIFIDILRHSLIVAGRPQSP